MENSLQEYYQYLSGAGSEFPAATEMIKSAYLRTTGDLSQNLDKTAAVINSTDEDLIKNYVLEKMAGKPLSAQQTVLNGIDAKLKLLRSEGEAIVPENIIKQIEDKTFL